MTSLLVLRSHTQHPVVQNKAEQQDDQEINQRECGGRPKVELPHRLLCQVLAKKGCGIARPAARQHKGFGVDHEAIHETRSEEHTSELQSLMRISYAVFCLKKKT